MNCTVAKSWTRRLSRDHFPLHFSCQPWLLSGLRTGSVFTSVPVFSGSGLGLVLPSPSCGRAAGLQSLTASSILLWAGWGGTPVIVLPFRGHMASRMSAHPPSSSSRECRELGRDPSESPFSGSL